MIFVVAWSIDHPVKLDRRCLLVAPKISKYLKYRVGLKDDANTLLFKEQWRDSDIFWTYGNTLKLSQGISWGCFRFCTQNRRHIRWKKIQMTDWFKFDCSQNEKNYASPTWLILSRGVWVGANPESFKTSGWYLVPWGYRINRKYPQNVAIPFVLEILCHFVILCQRSVSTQRQNNFKTGTNGTEVKEN